MITARFNLVADLLPLDHVCARRLQVLQVEHHIGLVAAKLYMDAKTSARAFFGRLVEAFVDAADDIAQQVFFLLKNSFTEHRTSSPEHHVFDTVAPPKTYDNMMVTAIFAVCD